MSKELLDRAHALIVQGKYADARSILEPLAAQSSTARRWLDNLSTPSAPPAPIVSPANSAPLPDNASPLNSDADPDPIMLTALGELATPNGSDERYLPLEGSAVQGNYTVPPSVRWEYREVVVKSWNQHMSNIEYALSQGGEKITIEDAYTLLLNENGAQGWEVVREELLPQQYVRLLLKRPVHT